MSTTIKTAGGATIVAEYNHNTGLVGYELTFSNGVTINANSNNLASKVQGIVDSGQYGGTNFNSTDLEQVKSVSADVPNIISQTASLAGPAPVPPADNPNATENQNNDTVENAAPTTIQTNNSVLAAITGKPDTKTTVDDGSDPYVSNGQSTIEVPEPQKPVDDGSDPYVSNGQSTIPPADQNTNPSSNTRGLLTKTNTQSQATQQDVNNFYQTGDWRVRLSLAPGSTYLYNNPSSGILKPLAATNGVLFPYTPNITVQYAAHYDSSDIVHSNYKIYQYKSSSVDQISISCDFTAQDTFEANYLLAVIHFFRSATKMFYGKDENPTAGTPPPLCYLTGLGSFQFDKHPLAITSFNYSLPTDVDYIRAGVTTTTGGVNKYPANQPATSVLNSAILTRLKGLLPGAKPKEPAFKNNSSSNPAGSQEPTYVPTKMQINITAIPIVTRNDISKEFSLAKYGTGELLRGSKRPKGGGGIW